MQAKEGRAFILGKMLEAIAEPRAELSEFAPRDHHHQDPDRQDPRHHRPRRQDDPLDHRGDRRRRSTSTTTAPSTSRRRDQGGEEAVAPHPDDHQGARDRREVPRPRRRRSSRSARSSSCSRARTACCTSRAWPRAASRRSRTCSTSATRSRSRSSTSTTAARSASTASTSPRRRQLRRASGDRPAATVRGGGPRGDRPRRRPRAAPAPLARQRSRARRRPGDARPRRRTMGRSRRDAASHADEGGRHVLRQDRPRQRHHRHHRAHGLACARSRSASGSPSGSRDETPAEAGMSHFIEHMMFKGTPTRTRRGDLRGVRPARRASSTRSPSKEYTCYYSRVLDEHAADGVRDPRRHGRATRSWTSRRDPSRARGRARGDLAHRGHARRPVHDLFAQTLWPDHPIGLPGPRQARDRRRLRPRADVFALHGPALPHRRRRRGGGGQRRPRRRSWRMVERAPRRCPRASAPTAASTRARDGRRGSRSSRKDTEQAHICWGATGCNAHHDDRFALVGPRRDPRRRDVVAAVPGDPREAGPGLRGLLLPRAVPGHRRVHGLRGHAARATPRRSSRLIQTEIEQRHAGRRHRRGARPREGVDEGPARAGPGEHAQPHDAPGQERGHAAARSSRSTSSSSASTPSTRTTCTRVARDDARRTARRSPWSAPFEADERRRTCSTRRRATREMSDDDRVVVAGAAGRMGREVVRAVTAPRTTWRSSPRSTRAPPASSIDDGARRQRRRASRDLAAAIAGAEPDVLVDFTHPTRGRGQRRAPRSPPAWTASSARPASPTERWAELAERRRDGHVPVRRAELRHRRRADDAVRRSRPRASCRTSRSSSCTTTRRPTRPPGTAMRTASLIAAARGERPDVPGRETEVARGRARRGASTASACTRCGCPGSSRTRRCSSAGRVRRSRSATTPSTARRFMPGVVLAVREVGGRARARRRPREADGAVTDRRRRRRAPVVVLKFGGTSVATAEGRAAVARARRGARSSAGDGVVVVVSAMGRAGAPYATDTLLVARSTAAPPTRASATCSRRAARSSRRSCVAHELRAAGIAGDARSPAREAGIVTDGALRRRARHRASTRRRCSRRIAAGVVPVVAGFQGVGRGRRDSRRSAAAARDTTACALGVALQRRGGRDLHRRRRRHDRRPARRATAPRVLDGDRARGALPDGARTAARSCTRPPPSSRCDAGVPVRVRNTFSDAPRHARRRHRRLPRRRGRDRRQPRRRHRAGRASRCPQPRATTAHMAAQTRRLPRAWPTRASRSTCSRPCGDTLVFTVAEDGLPEAVSASLDGLGLPYEVDDRAGEGHAGRRGHARRARRHGARGRALLRRRRRRPADGRLAHHDLGARAAKDADDRGPRAARRVRAGGVGGGSSAAEPGCYDPVRGLGRSDSGGYPDR